MRALTRVLFLSTTAALTLSAGSAMALFGFEDGIPNGAFGGTDQCVYCHTMPTGGPRTPFGLEFENKTSVTDILAAWPEVSQLDSDGDGASNGLELGDPCGEWTSGETPARTDDITSPGDPMATTSATMTEMCAPIGGMVDTTAAGPAPKHPGFQQGFCAVGGGAGGAGGSAWGLVALGAVAALLGARRRASR